MPAKAQSRRRNIRGFVLAAPNLFHAVQLPNYIFIGQISKDSRHDITSTTEDLHFIERFNKFVDELR